MPRLLPARRNMLAYPAGIAPGFDPANPFAAGKFAISAVATPSMFVALTGGAGITPILSGTPTPAMDGIIGPCINYASSQKQFFGTPSSPTPITLAAIFRTGAVVGSSGYGGVVYWQSPNAGIYANYAGGGKLTLAGQGGTAVISSLGVATNTAYFAAATLDGSGNAQFVLTNLATGTVQYASGSGFTSSANSANLVIGNDANANTPLNGNVAAVAALPTLLSPQQLLQWAMDPWSFWYPRKDLLYAASTGTAFTLAAAVGSFALNGIAAALKSTRSLAAAKGTFNLTGIAASPKSARALSAAKGSFALNGVSATLSRGLVLSAAKGTFTLNGIAATLSTGHGYALIASAGSFGLTGHAAIFPTGRSIAAGPGSFGVNGVSATLKASLQQGTWTTLGAPSSAWTNINAPTNTWTLE